MDIISKVFARSPFASLKLQAEAVQACLVRIEPLSWAVRSGDANEVNRLRAELDQIMSAQRSLSEEVRDHLAGGHLLPVGRERLIAVVDSIESLQETGQDFAELLQRRSLALPEELSSRFDFALRLAIQTACLAAELVRRFELLPQVGCDGPEIDKLRILLDDVEASRAKCDELRSGIELEIGSYESAMSSPDFVYSEHVIGEVRRLVASAQRLAHRVHLLIGRRETTTASSVGPQREAHANAQQDSPCSESSDGAVDRFSSGDVLEPVSTSAQDSWSS